jgi:hypothetical protein
MTTLATMKNRIARETTRDDLLDSGAIAEEILSAIAFYAPHRFWFNEKRSTVTFDTVIGQTDYAAAANIHIPNLIRMDYATVAYGSGDTAVMTYAQPRDMDILLGNAPVSRSRPYRYSYYESVLRLYPEPDQVYPVRIAGVIRIAPPATDDEAGNAWMTEAEELIRARSKRNLYLNSMIGTEATQVSAMRAFEDEALERLRRETSSRSQVNYIRPSCL